MDEGVVALAVAGIGVGGVVLTAALGFRGARLQAKAQVDAALAGVREQKRLEQNVELLAARRAAYAEFLGQIEMVRMAIDRAFHVHERVVEAVEHERLTHTPMPPALTWMTTMEQMEAAVNGLWFRHSTLRLHADEQIADEAEQLIRTARKAADEFDLAGTALGEEWSLEPHHAVIRGAIAELKAGARAWADAAAASLGRPIP